MNRILVLLVCVACISAQLVTIVSSDLTTTITSPLGLTTGYENYHNTNNPDYLGTGAQWIWNSLGSSVANGVANIFERLFYADCYSQPATIRITADNVFTAYLNNVAVGSGSDWTKVYVFNLKLQCGKNNLTVVVTNKDEGSPAALIFSIVQNQTDCYTCKNQLGGYYNRETCQCECINSCICLPPLTWFDYPTCSCGCKYAVQCEKWQFWNKKTCRCECTKVYCPKGKIQNPKSCKCQCPQVLACPRGQVWNSDTCRCECPKIDCPKGQFQNSLNCKCQCAQSVLCIKGLVWNPSTCTCVKPCEPINCGINPNYVFNTATCQCEYNPPTYITNALTSSDSP